MGVLGYAEPQLNFTLGSIVFIYSSLLLCWHFHPAENSVPNQKELEVTEPSTANDNKN